MLRERDFRLLLDAVHDLNQPRALEEFRPAARRITSQIVGCETASFSEIDVQTGRHLGLIHPISTGENHRLEPLLLRFIHQNPAIVHQLRNPDSTTSCVADFIAQRDFRRTALYHEVFRHVAIEQQALVGLGMHGSANVCILLHRSRRAFSGREVALLDVLRPHLIQAYDNTRHFSPMRGAALDARTLHERDEDRVLVVKRDRIVFCSDDARSLLQRYFGEIGWRLPLEIKSWLRAHDAKSLLSVAPLRIEKAAFTLVVRRSGANEDGVLLLLQELETGAPRIDISRFGIARDMSGFARPEKHDVAPDVLMNLGLTLRQSEVLKLVSRGLTNGEIAHQLAISAHTVRHHLEAIYHILGVSNRHAASNAARRHFAPDSSPEFPAKIGRSSHSFPMRVAL